MSLPARTNLDDIEAVCKYLVTKPTGATLAEAKAVVDNKHLVGRKMTALKYWRIIESEDNRFKVTDLGRQAVKDSGAFQSDALRDIVRRIEPYKAIIERVVNREEETLTATDVAAHWYEHFKDDVSEIDKTLNEQAICFFQIAQGADFGKLTIGRKGMRTRFDFDADNSKSFVGTFSSETLYEDTQLNDTQHPLMPEDSTESLEQLTVSEIDAQEDPMDGEPTGSVRSVESDRVFIAHGKNHNILEQVKEIVEFGKYEPVISMNQETTAKPVPQKVMDDMRSCGAAVILVSADNLDDDESEKPPQINANVLIEIGAAMALYDDKFVLLVEEGVELPSNLQGLYECRYSGDELSWATTRKLLQAFNDFR